MDIDKLFAWYQRNAEYLDHARMAWEAAQKDLFCVAAEPTPPPPEPRPIDTPPELPPHQVRAGPFSPGPPRHIPEPQPNGHDDEPEYKRNMRQGAR